MARRRRPVKKQAPKKMLKLDTEFDCPFCVYARGTVECSFDWKESIGSIACYICTASYHTKIHALTEPIDMYHEWIDECERANRVNEDALKQ